MPITLIPRPETDPTSSSQQQGHSSAAWPALSSTIKAATCLQDSSHRLYTAWCGVSALQRLSSCWSSSCRWGFSAQQQHNSNAAAKPQTSLSFSCWWMPMQFVSDSRPGLSLLAYCHYHSGSFEQAASTCVLLWSWPVYCSMPPALIPVEQQTFHAGSTNHVLCWHCSHTDTSS